MSLGPRAGVGTFTDPVRYTAFWTEAPKRCDNSRPSGAMLPWVLGWLLSGITKLCLSVGSAHQPACRIGDVRDSGKIARSDPS